jgi:hypothetical protein
VNEGAEVDMEGEDRGNREGVESVVRESEEEVVQRRKRDQPGVTRSSTISSQFETSTLQTRFVSHQCVEVQKSLDVRYGQRPSPSGTRTAGLCSPGHL